MEWVEGGGGSLFFATLSLYNFIDAKTDLKEWGIFLIRRDLLRNCPKKNQHYIHKKRIRVLTPPRIFHLKIYNLVVSVVGLDIG